MKNDARTRRAIEVLAAGGHFRYALEAGYMGREKFQARLRTASGEVIKGIGYATLRELETAGKLARRECAPSSTFPQEWVLNSCSVCGVIGHDGGACAYRFGGPNYDHVSTPDGV